MSSSESRGRNAAWGVNKKRKREFSYDIAVKKPYREQRMLESELNFLKAKYQSADEPLRIEMLRDQWIQNRKDELEVFLTNVQTNISSGLGAEDLIQWKNQSAALEEAANRNSKNFIGQREALITSIKQVRPLESPETLEYEIGECVFDTLYYVAGIDAYIHMRNQHATVAQTIEHLDPEYNHGRRKLACDDIDKPLICCSHSDMRDKLLKTMYEQLDRFSLLVLGGSEKKREELVYSIGPKRSVKQMLSGFSARWTNKFDFVKKSGIRHRLALGIHFAIVEQNLDNRKVGIRTNADYAPIFSNSTMTPSKAVQKLIETHECVAVEYMALLWRIFTGDGSFKDADPADGELLLPKIPSYGKKQAPTFQQMYAPKKPNADAEVEEWRALHFMRRVVYSSASQDWFLHSASSAMLLSILFGASTQEGWGAILSAYGDTAYTNILKEELRDTTIMSKMAYGATYLWQSVNYKDLRALGYQSVMCGPWIMNKLGRPMNPEERHHAQVTIDNDPQRHRAQTTELVQQSHAFELARDAYQKGRIDEQELAGRGPKAAVGPEPRYFQFVTDYVGWKTGTAVLVTIAISSGGLSHAVEYLAKNNPSVNAAVNLATALKDFGASGANALTAWLTVGKYIGYTFEGVGSVAVKIMDAVGNGSDTIKQPVRYVKTAVETALSPDWYTGPAKGGLVDAIGAHAQASYRKRNYRDYTNSNVDTSAVQMSVGAMAIDPSYKGGEITYVLSSKTAKDDDRASDRAYDRAYNLSSSQLSAVFGVFPHRRAIALKEIFPDGPKGASMLEDDILAKMKVEEELVYDMD